nr:16S rRNA (adenine(1518)-N(6)/adenine(1519)-N(6))-dimethyltransferase RsmA [Flaviflexus huanghaiensis]
MSDRLGIRPTKTLGQNFVGDGGTVRKIVSHAGVCVGDHVLEIGPGLGSLTLALLEAGAYVSAIEIDPVLASALPETVAARHDRPERFAVAQFDALKLADHELAVPPALDRMVPTFLVANLPYNVAVPALLTAFEVLPSLTVVDVMVQLEVAERLAAPPGSRVYGVPSVKAAWYAEATRGPLISRSVFWPVPNVDSALVRFDRRREPSADRVAVFAVIDAAFSQRRKTLRQALASWAGSAARAEERLRAAGIDPQRRGETLTIDDFVAIANAEA